MTGTKQKKEAAPKVSVKVVKEGWTHRGKDMEVGDTADVTEQQAVKLREKGLVK